MRRKEAFFIIGITGVAALLLWLWARHESPRPAADAFAASEMDAIVQLRRLLLQKPQQPAFAVCWQSKLNERTGWSDLKYNRAKHTLIYTPYKDYGKGCPKRYICESVSDALLIKATHYKSIGTIMYASGCSNAGCLTGCSGGCLSAD